MPTATTMQAGQPAFRNRAYEIASRLPEEALELVAEVGISFVAGAAAAEVGATALALTVLGVTAGAAKGARDGVKAAIRNASPLQFHSELSPGIVLLAVSGMGMMNNSKPLQHIDKLLNLGANVGFAAAIAIFTRSIVGFPVQAKEALRGRVDNGRRPNPAAKAAEWAVGAFAGATLAGGLVLSGAAEVGLATVAGTVTAKAARAGVRAVQARWFH